MQIELTAPIKRDDAIKLLGISLSTSRALVENNMLPPPIKLGTTTYKGWPAGEINIMQKAFAANASKQALQDLTAKLLKKRDDDLTAALSPYLGESDSRLSALAHG